MKTSSNTSIADDPILAEVREARDEMAREANYDINALCEKLREAERRHPERLIKTPPRERVRK